MKRLAIYAVLLALLGLGVTYRYSHAPTSAQATVSTTTSASQPTATLSNPNVNLVSAAPAASAPVTAAQNAPAADAPVATGADKTKVTTAKPGADKDIWSLLKDPTISLLLWIIAGLFAIWLLGRWVSSQNQPYKPKGKSDEGFEYDEFGNPYDPRDTRNQGRRTPRIGDQPPHGGHYDFDDWRNDFTGGMTGGGNSKSPAQLILPSSPDVFNRHDAKLPHGILLVGPPGTGKTLLARALAGEADASMFITTGSSFVEMYVGVGASRIRALFEDARNQRKKTGKPVIIFIDEIDAVGGARSNSANSNSEREQTLNQLLTEVDGFKQNEGIIVLAATNRSDMLDPALRRKGRFDQEIMVDLPDATGREAIIKVHARKKTLAPDVDFALLARRTFGFNGADLEAACNEAAVIAARKQSAIEKAEKALKAEEDAKAAASAPPPPPQKSEPAPAQRQRPRWDADDLVMGEPRPSPPVVVVQPKPVETRVIPITNEIFDEAISVVEAGEARHDRLQAMSAMDKRQTAYHELGHAIVTLVLRGDPITKITILPRGRALGYVQTHTENDRWNLTREQLLMRITSAMAGRLGQEVFMNTSDTGATSDFQQANDLARKMVTQFGMSKLGRIYIPDSAGANLTLAVGPALADAIDAETRAIINDCEAKARSILEENRQAIEALCTVLVEKETLLGAELTSRFEELTKRDSQGK
jgi:ATP-dependent Zn protease